MSTEIIKLTPKQNAVIWCLQNGWSIITNHDIKGATISSKTHQYRINNGLFWNLVDKGLIHQGGTEERFWYVLTALGKKIKTKPVVF